MRAGRGGEALRPLAIVVEAFDPRSQQEDLRRQCFQRRVPVFVLYGVEGVVWCVCGRFENAWCPFQ